MARNLRNLSALNRSRQALEANQKAKIVEPTSPQPPQVTSPAPITLNQGLLVEGMDYGAIKVENGKLVVDMDDFLPDYGLYDSIG